jgi:uncharacterized iron-regulated membrane protein
MFESGLDAAPVVADAAADRRRTLRSAWVSVHRWLGLTLGCVGALLGLTGSLLVFSGEIDGALNPQRYAVSGPEAALPYADYLAAASSAAGGKARVLLVQMPGQAGGPVVVALRPKEGDGVVRVYLDPASARVLDVSRGAGFIDAVHRFYESLMLRGLWGREFIGIVGIAMLISALSGLYLWWPGRRKVRLALAFRPRLALYRNLHYFFGFYASWVLAVVAFTGIYLAFPNAVRVAVNAVSPVSLSLRGGPPPASASPATPSVTRDVRVPDIGPDKAAAIAQALVPDAQVATIGLPGGATGSYRIVLREPGDPHTVRGGNAVVLVDASNGTVLRQVDASTRTAGDTFLAWQNPLHTGEAFGNASRVLVSAAGLVPSLLFVTGMIMWLKARKRARRGN